MSDEDAAHLEQIKAKTHLSWSALSRLLFHRGLHAYLRDGQLAD